MSHNSSNLYVRLFHGRNQPNDQLSDWGFDGPVIGPVGISWTYGDVKLHPTDWSDCEMLRTRLGLVVYQGKYYGDLEILVEGDPSIDDAVAFSGQPIHSYETFVANLRAPAAAESPRRVVRGRPTEPLPLP